MELNITETSFITLCERVDELEKNVSEILERLDCCFNMEHDDSLPSMIYKNERAILEHRKDYLETIKVLINQIAELEL